MRSLTLLLGALCTATIAQATSVGTYSVGPVIPWSPKAASSVDQSVVYNDLYYLSDRTNAGVHVISVVNNTQITLVKGFVTGLVNGSLSSAISGPDGLVVVAEKNELWVGDGDGTVKVISLESNTIVANISTGSKKRADEFAYDPKNGIIVVTNPNEDTPYVSIISTANRTVLGKIEFSNSSGLEQPAFDSVSGTFYVSLPSSGAYPNGGVSALNIATMAIQHTYPLPPCIPAGIVFGPQQNLLVTCSQDQIKNFGYAASYVLDISNGSIIANISGLAGVDQVAYDPNAKLYYASAYQMLAGGNGSAPTPFVGIIDAVTNKLIQKFPTDNVTAHSVAVDLKNNAIYVPIKAKGIQVYTLSGSSSNSTNASTASGSPVASSTSSSATPGVAMAPLLGLGMLSLVAFFALW